MPSLQSSHAMTAMVDEPRYSMSLNIWQLRMNVFVIKIILSLTFSALVFFTDLQASEAVFHQKNLVISGYIGNSRVNKIRDQYLIISPYVTDWLLHTKTKNNPSLNLSLKKNVEGGEGFFPWLSLGPSINIQSIKVSGDVWEMLSPEFFNYQYSFVSRNVQLLLEGELYFAGTEKQWLPFLTAGAGFGMFFAKYHDDPLPGIPPGSGLSWDKLRIMPLASLGGGLRFSFNEHWSSALRYAFYYTNKMKVSIRTYRPLYFDENSHNLQLGIHYRV